MKIVKYDYYVKFNKKNVSELDVYNYLEVILKESLRKNLLPNGYTDEEINQIGYTFYAKDFYARKGWFKKEKWCEITIESDVIYIK